MELSKDEIIRMALESKMVPDARNVWFECCYHDLERFAALVAAYEREKEIKRVAEGHGWTQAHWTEYEHAIAATEREACCSGDVVNAADIGGADHPHQVVAKYQAAIRARGEK